MDDKIIKELREELTRRADEAVRLSSHNFFKEPVKFYGIKHTDLGRISKQYFKDIKNRSKQEIFSICEELLRSDYGEEAFIVFDWVYWIRDSYQPEDMETFERWLNLYVNNWAKCDSFCNHAVSALVEKYPAFIARLKEWTHSDNRWVRRASAVTLIIPARKGLFLRDIFEIADILLLDKDDLVQKGYGWMLKAASQYDQQSVFDYVVRNKATMPRTALRYAIEKLPPELRQQAMAK